MQAQCLGMRTFTDVPSVPSDHLLTCDTIGGLEDGRLADLRDLVADWADSRTNRGL